MRRLLLCLVLMPGGCNDITFASAVVVDNLSGNGGSLTLQAGRNLNFNANLTTDHGNLTAVAGDPSAIASEREPGVATITIANGVGINAGSGVVTLASVDGDFMNHSGSSTPITASRWFVYSTDPARNVLGGMTPHGQGYSQPYIAGSTPGYAPGGNWLFYTTASVFSEPKVPQDVIDNAQKPPVDFVVDKPLASGGCTTALFVIGSASAVFERFYDVEDDTCELDFIEDSAEDDGRKKRKCRPKESEQPSKPKTDKL